MADLDDARQDRGAVTQDPMEDELVDLNDENDTDFGAPIDSDMGGTVGQVNSGRADVGHTANEGARGSGGVDEAYGVYSNSGHGVGVGDNDDVIGQTTDGATGIAGTDSGATDVGGSAGGPMTGHATDIGGEVDDDMDDSFDGGRQVADNEAVVGGLTDSDLGRSVR